MKPPAEWTTPADIRNEVERLWNTGRILSARIDNTELFPYALRLRRPEASALTERFDEVRRWIRALEQASKAAIGFGYDIEWIEINHRQLGRNRLPLRISVATEADAIRILGKEHAAKRFAELAHQTLARFPALIGWLARHPLVALAHADNWNRVLAVLTWFYNNPRPGLYLRQLDIHGVDTKFIEVRKGLLAELLDAVLPPDAVDTRFAGAVNFDQRYGLAVEPVLVRFRVLDPRHRIQDLSDLTVPAPNSPACRSLPSAYSSRKTRSMAWRFRKQQTALLSLDWATAWFGLRRQNGCITRRCITGGISTPMGLPFSTACALCFRMPCRS